MRDFGVEVKAQHVRHTCVSPTVSSTHQPSAAYILFPALITLFTNTA